ncbi:hypothetical protein [Xanthomonas phage XAJ2]|uniref:Uncharacterized protein n=1 Tax=Xanthomonas phage XAJ2 TaxID=1775249 RepID=A0A1I9L2H2_9CAUD|nr:hypothetical protein [Xanthomonas phage XAJ2]
MNIEQTPAYLALIAFEDTEARQVMDMPTLKRYRELKAAYKAEYERINKEK